MSEIYGTFSTAYVEAMRLRLSALEPENKGLSARVAELEARCKRLEELGSKLEEEKEAHAWEISPAMAQAKIDELNARVAELEARCKRLKEAAREVYLDMIASDHQWSTNETRNMHALRDVLEAKP